MSIESREKTYRGRRYGKKRLDIQPLKSYSETTKTKAVTTMGFLEDLYLNGYLPSENDRPQTLEYAKACKQVQEYEGRIIKTMGEQFMDDYYTAKGEQITMEIAHAYAQETAENSV